MGGASGLLLPRNILHQITVAFLNVFIGYRGFAGKLVGKPQLPGLSRFIVFSLPFRRPDIPEEVLFLEDDLRLCMRVVGASISKDHENGKYTQPAGKFFKKI